MSLEQQYRIFLYASSLLGFIGAIVELWFVEHIETTVQLFPFYMCGIGIIMTAVTWFTPNGIVIKIHRAVMLLILLGGVWGITEHVEHNLAFELEIRPNATTGDVIWEALHGASPFLAPGMLSFAALLAFAATWRHPLLSKKTVDDE